MNREEVALYIASIDEPGALKLSRLLAEYDASVAGYQRFIDELNAGALPIEDTDKEMNSALTTWVARRPTAGQIADMLRTLKARDIKVLLPWEDAYPEALNILDASKPRVLFAQGDLSILGAPTVAIVGARAATSYGEHLVQDLVGGLAQRGYTIVSGAAFGIDGQAHRAALGHGAKTIAVLAGGLDSVYPDGHANLVDRIREHGLVLSELPPLSRPSRWRFLQRNRIIAALSGALVVVEAGVRSGSLNAASHAMAIGIPVGAVPGPITSPASAGPHRLIRDLGAKLVTSAEEIVEIFRQR